MDINNNSFTMKKTLVALSAASLFAVAAPSFASDPTSGQLVLINAVANVINGSGGNTSSSIKVVVNDATGPCSTTATLAYGGIITVKWDSTKAHTATQCTNIASVDVSALKTIVGTVQYDSTANATPPAVATAPTNFAAPTTPITNLALIVTGAASAAQVNSATVWGSALGVVPAYSTSNGSLTTTGIMGAVGSAGMKAADLMNRYGVRPAL